MTQVFTNKDKNNPNNHYCRSDTRKFSDSFLFVIKYFM